MNMEKKPVKRSSKQSKDTSKKQELVFVDKEKDCSNCPKEQELTVSLGVTLESEWEKVVPLTLKYGHTPDEVKYIYNFYNRTFKQNKQPGCGKCFVNVCRAIRNRWAEMNR